MKWIKIEDKCEMPDYDHPVLWLCEDGNMHVEALDKDGNPWLFEEDKNSEWYTPGNKATHWIELPERPDSIMNIKKGDSVEYLEWGIVEQLHYNTKDELANVNISGRFYALSADRLIRTR